MFFFLIIFHMLKIKCIFGAYIRLLLRYQSDYQDAAYLKY